ncbi:MAG: hypothetical protein K5864_01115 [Bacteroidales bacterium]|nr:hypothetical protein [Bacteroidales bacterium]
MKKKLLILLGACMLLWACKSELDGTINEVAEDGVVDETEYALLVAAAKQEKKCLGDDGEVDDAILQTYVQKYASKKWRSSEPLVFNLKKEKKEPISFQFYLERSGSMFGYDNPQTNGYFSTAIGNIINTIPNKESESNLLFIVNDDVYPANISLDNLLFGTTSGQRIYQMDSIKEKGDTKWTYFSAIFDSILSRSNNNEVSILVSDLIYSAPNNLEYSREALLNLESESTRGKFKKYKDKDVIIVKCNVGFKGKYYPYNEPLGGKDYTGPRPVYFMIVAKSNVMQRLFNDPLYKDFRTFSALKGYENYHCFTHQSKEPIWSVLYTDPFGMTQASFSAARDGKDQIHNIEKLSVSRSRGGNNSTIITLALDLSNIIVDPSYLTDVSHYMIDDNEGGWKIQEVIPLKKENRTTDVTNYVKNATHLLVLSTDEKPMNEKLHISLFNEFPKWIEESTSEDDTRLTDPKFKTTTWGFKTMMEGIYNSYYSVSEKPKYFEITMGIKRK